MARLRHGYVTVMAQNLFCFYTWHGTDTITARHGLMCHKGSEMGHDLMKDDIVVVVHLLFKSEALGSYLGNIFPFQTVIP